MSLHLKVVIVSLALTGTFANAQPVNPFAGKDATQGVYVRDSATAVEKLALAERMERLKEWEKSADVYQEVADKYADRIVPSQLDRNQTIYQYTSVVSTVRRRLSKWPLEGLNVYLHKYEPAAASMLEAAAPDDLAALNRVVSQYFVTEAGKSAAIRLIDLNLESGDFAAAAWLGEQILEIHPNIQAERAKLTYRTALAHHLAGDEKAAAARLADLKQKDPDAAGVVHGVDIKLAESLEAELKIPPPTARDASADSWPMLGGGTDRARVTDAKGKPGAKLFDVLLDKRSQPIVPDPSLRPQYIIQANAARESGLMLGIMPVVDGGELFFQDNARVYAVRLESNVPLPGWLSTHGSERHGQYVTDNATARPRSVQLNVALTDNSVIAILGQVDRLAAQFNATPQNRECKLVCLDRERGREKWVVTPKKLPDSLSNLRTVEFGGAPLVVGDNVYVTARGGKPMQFEDAYVLCYALTDGKFRWACYVASGSVPGEVFEGAAAMSENISQLAYSSGRLYALTNLGALAAIDAYRGTIVWLNIYPRPERNMMAFQPRFDVPPASGAGAKPWAFNPPIVKDGKVFILPADSDNLLVYDAGNGVENKRIQLSDFDDADTMIGVVGERLVLSGDNRLWCVNWRDYEQKKTSDGNLFWSSNQEMDKKDQSPLRKPWIMGRGFLTSDSVIIPNRWGLRRFDLKSGRLTETYPSSGQWSAREEEPGNITATQDHVIIAGAERVAVYTDMTLAKSKLDAEEAAAPTQPEPRLKYAEMMFVSGQYDLAVSKLDEAIQLIGGIGAMKKGADRDRIFGDALAFAQKLGDPQSNTPEIMQRAETMFQRASAAADSPAQQVQYRLAHRKFANRMRDFPMEVQLCQQILSDPAMRNVAVNSDANSAPLLAGAYAEGVIGELIKNFPGIYKEFDQKAAEELEKAKQSNDAAALLAVAQVYPNSAVAAESMLAAAEVYESTGNPRAATQVLNQAYRRFTERSEEDKAKIIEAQARNYLALPNGIGIAMGRLEEGAKLRTNPTLQRPLKLPDGSTLEKVSFSDARTALQKYNSAIVTRALPDLKIPVPAEHRQAVENPFAPEDPAAVISGVDDFLTPPREYSRNDRIATWSSEKGVSIYAVGATTPLGSSAAMSEPPRGAAWLGDKLAVYGASKVVLLQGDNAQTLWEASLKDLPRAELVATEEEPQEPAAEPPPPQRQVRRPQVIRLNNQRIVVVNGKVRLPQNPPVGMFNNEPRERAPGEGEAIEHLCLAGDRIVLGTSTGRIFGLETATGKLSWQTRLTANALEQVLASDDFVAARFADESGAQIVALDTFAGQTVYRRAFGGADGSVPQNMALAPSGQLVYTLPDRLCIKDLFEGAGDIVEWPADGSLLYAGAEGADKLVISDGRALAVGDGGQFVRVHSLQTGRTISPPLSTGSTPNNWNVALRVVGSHLYVVNQKTVKGYNLDNADDNWPGQVLPNQTPAIREAFVGTKFLVLLDQPTAPPGRASPAAPFRLQMYNLSVTSRGLQDGRISYVPVIRHAQGITDWQAVDGGFYYRSGDGKLHFLKGLEAAQ